MAREEIKNSKAKMPSFHSATYGFFFFLAWDYCFYSLHNTRRVTLHKVTESMSPLMHAMLSKLNRCIPESSLHTRTHTHTNTHITHLYTYVPQTQGRLENKFFSRSSSSSRQLALSLVEHIFDWMRRGTHIHKISSS
jgi:hypothetical protein